jgi:uncharacterized protein YihD (DUF1040 family)
MRDPLRIPIVLEALKKAWEVNPDTRLCQLISNLTTESEDIFYVEDSEILKLLKTHINDRKQ